MHSRPVMSAGMVPEVDASAGCAPPAGAYFFSQAQPEETPVPEGPSFPPSLPPPPPPPAAMLITVGMVPLVLVDCAAGSGEVLVMPEEAVSMVDCCAVLSGAVSVWRALGVVQVTAGEVLLMEAASGVMLVMGGWGRMELSWGAALGLLAAAMSLRPCMRDTGTLMLPAASLCSATQQANCIEPEASKAGKSGNFAMVTTSAKSMILHPRSSV